MIPPVSERRNVYNYVTLSLIPLVFNFLNPVDKIISKYSTVEFVFLQVFNRWIL